MLFGSIMYSLAMPTIKIGLLLLYRRIFIAKNYGLFRGAWWTIFVMVFPIWTVLILTLIGLQIGRPAMFFSAAVLNQIMTIVMRALHSISDIAIMLLPMRIVWHLQLSVRDRLGLMIVFVLGAL
jgi:hypothetical protein